MKKIIKIISAHCLHGPKGILTKFESEGSAAKGTFFGYLIAVKSGLSKPKFLVSWLMLLNSLAVIHLSNFLIFLAIASGLY